MSARSPAAPSGGYEQSERGAREPARSSAWPVRCRVAARDQHDCRWVRPFGELVRHRKPVEARQLDVEEDDGRPQRCDGLERRITVRSLPDDREALRLEQRTGRVLVTSQNHGFCVDASEAPEVTHVSLYDGTVEGLDFPELRARAIQFHPEAGPGPHDAWLLIDEFVERAGLAQAA